MFLANLPTWNYLVGVFRVRPAVEGNEFRGTMDAQVYSALKRVNLDFEGEPSTIILLYPTETAIVLYPPHITETGQPTDTLTVVSFPWVHSPYDNGVMYCNVLITGPRYGHFPNEHCCAIITPITLAGKLLWFGPDPVVTWTGAADASCDQCSELPLTFTLTDGWVNGRSTPMFFWGCSSSGSAHVVYEYSAALPKVLVRLRESTGITAAEWSLATTWDEVTPIALPLTFTEDPGLCVFPATVLLTPEP